MEKVLRREVEFVEEWMGNPIGSKKVIIANWADELKKRKTVVFVESKEEKKADDNKEEKEPEVKIMKRAPKDKMMKNQNAKEV